MRVTIDGKEYELIPVENEAESVLEDYKVQDEVQTETGVKDAVPVVSEYRERYKKKQVKFSEVSAPPKRYSKIDKTNSSLDDYEYKGEKLFVGDGLVEEG